MSTLQCRTSGAFANHIFWMLILIKQLITFSRDTSSSSFIIALIAHMFFQIFLPTINELYAYCRWDSLTPYSPTWYPSKRSDCIAFDMITLNPSSSNKIRKGDRESPCLSPLPTINSFEGLPFPSSNIQDDLRHSFIYHLYLSLNPILVITLSRYLKFTES